MLSHIISANDKVFLSSFWQSLFRKLGTKLHFSTSYHTQSDGQIERVNQCLETYLRCTCSDRPKDWCNWLALAEFWYNTNYHSSIKMSPFEALKGYRAPQLAFSAHLKDLNSDSSDILQQTLKVTQVLKGNL
ncbi:hypothetical protein LIER_31128 [Lithospermum erythrorhizon]|uniref:Integrase catalytic domain-containing protein n=1 Tax=Lithospermum erythrorhizon TaxID=34254 RepID=A0AAV3RQP2_LITER